MDPFDQLWDEEYLRKEVKEYFGEFDESRWNLDAGITEDSKLEDYNLHTKGFVYQAAWNCAKNDERGKYTVIKDLILERGLGRVLDYGCGIGSGVIALALFGNYAIGAEVNKHCLGFLWERIRRFELGLKVAMLDITNGPDIENIGPFGYIICTEVLEHLSNPHEVAQKLVNSLKPGGVAVLSWSFVPMPGHLPEHFHLQAPHPDDLLTMGFGKFVQELGMEFKGYSWFNNMIWEKSL